MKKVISFLLALVLAVSLLGLQIFAAEGPLAGQVSVRQGSLNVRSGAGTGSSVVASLKKGAYLTLRSKNGDWWQVEYAKGKLGYCHGSYITTLSASPARVSTQSLSLNVRSGPGTSYARQGGLSRGETVFVLSTAGGWSKILYHGNQIGYVSAQYLSAQSQSGVKYPAHSLSVPNFKQNDSRWANVYIGTSGKTMAQIGCATTAISMMESRRTGSTVYPDAMSKKLSYTASGNVYWPAHYTTVWQYDLSALYELVKQGKPVLFGAKTSSGKQHWVVITGFAGGDILTAAGFSIHDPGTNSRTNLQHFLNAYPVFYKYFHY